MLREFLRIAAGKVTVRDVEVVVSNPTDEELTAHDEWLVSDWRKKLAWLRRKYVPIRGLTALEFPSGCLLNVEGNVVTFRKRCEWFRKSMTDVRFVCEMTGATSLTLRIPQLWTRPLETPVIAMWARDSGDSPEWLDNAATTIEKRYPLEEAVKVSNSIARRYLIRYYLLRGDIDASEYNRQRQKLSAEMKLNPDLQVVRRRTN